MSYCLLLTLDMSYCLLLTLDMSYCLVLPLYVCYSLLLTSVMRYSFLLTSPTDVSCLLTLVSCSLLRTPGMSSAKGEGKQLPLCSPSHYFLRFSSLGFVFFRVHVCI